MSADEYIKTFPPDKQAVLRQVREAIRKAVPDAAPHAEEPPAAAEKPRIEAAPAKRKVQAVPVISAAHAASLMGRKAGYTGGSCGSCGSVRVRRNGTCIVCDDCGTTLGCS